MPIKKIFLCVVFIAFLNSCQNNFCSNVEFDIIPYPSLQLGTPENFSLTKNTGLEYDPEFSISATFLKNYIESGSNFKLKSNSKNTTICFIKDNSIHKQEAYKLEILKKEIRIKAKTDQGAFYAVQTLRQLLPIEFENGSFKGKKVIIPGAIIEDAPKFTYRGMHLDVGRHMFSVNFIKKYIDALAMLKMNTFHWHLTEDQGWRIEIKKYPKLQDIAAFRDETLIGHYNNQPHQFDGKKYGGYYTQEDIKEVVAYAHARHVTVIPEIELPGHSQAAIAAYPNLGCTSKDLVTNEQIEVAKKWGVFEDIYCTKDETFEFLEDVLDEVLTLFPSQYIHIGGDEAPKTKWKTCNDCQNRIKKEGLKDEHELQNYFITRIEKHLNNKGRQIIGWDEILEGGLAPNATVMSWRGTQGAITAAKQQHNVVMTPTSHCYFDYYQSENDQEPLAIGGFLPLEKTYNFNPIPEELTKEETQYVLGAQGNIWTEYMSTEAQVEYMAFPRILAMSEVVWSNLENKNYENFVSRVETFNKRLDALEINYANHLYEIKGEMISKNNANAYALSTLLKDKVIYYTTNGSAPNLFSEIYKEPIIITESMKIKAAVFGDNKKLGSTFSENINYHKAVGKKITINKKPHKAYSGSGANGLVNGVSGSNKRYGDKEWLGFWGDDLEILIDLGEETDIKSIKTRFYNGKGQWIYAPKDIEFEFENESEGQTLKIENSEDLLIDIHFKTQVKSRYIKLKIPSYGIIPEGKQGAGQKAWTFIDEIIIN